MPRNGAGVFSLVNNTWFPPVNGVLATATDWTAFITDVQNALTQSVSSDGQTPMTGNLPMGNNKITGLATGTASTDAVNLSQVNSNAGQCRLVKSGANLVLQPYQGNRLTINGVVFTIPSAGVSLAPAGSVATTLYYIYAFMVGAVMTLEYSTTGHSTDTATGVEIKTGDATRTLVGMARPIAGPAWADTAALRFVLSWFNRRQIYLAVATQNGGPYSGALVESNANDRIQFLTWAGDLIQGLLQIQVNGGATASFTAQNLDGTTASPTFLTSQGFFSATPQWLGTTPSEGYHYLAFYIGTNSGVTSQWLGGGASFNNATILG